MIDIIIGLIGLIATIAFSYFSYVKGRRNSEKEILEQKKMNVSLKEIADKQEVLIINLESQLNVIHSEDINQRKKEFEYQQQKDFITGLWTAYKHLNEE